MPTLYHVISCCTLVHMKIVRSGLVFFIGIIMFSALFFLNLRNSVHAQDSSEMIRSYDVSIDVEKSGEILVSEEVYYDFGSNYKHGMYRNIPYLKIVTDPTTGKNDQTLGKKKKFKMDE